MTYKRPKLVYDHRIWQHKMRCLQAYLNLEYDFRAVIEKVIPVVNLIGGRSQLYDAMAAAGTQMLPNATEIVLPHSVMRYRWMSPLGFIRY